MNTYGTRFRLTDFGESHGKAMGGVIDGVPAGFQFDLAAIQKYVDRRRPGSSRLVSSRQEEDKVEFLSGMDENGVAYGTPIGFLIRNTNSRASDYERYKGKLRPNHADYTYLKKYGDFGLTGGGRSSGRQTVCRVVAGAFASQILAKLGISINAYISRIGTVALPEKYPADIPSGISKDMEALIERVSKEGDSVGGMVSCIIKNVPVGVGEPVYHKLQSELAAAMMGINGAKGFEYGLGMESASSFGSDTADIFYADNGEIRTRTNHSGGIQGGISNGEAINFSVAFKPTPTIMRQMDTVDFEGNPAILEPTGRHDPCIALRAAVVVEAMAALVLVNYV